MSGSIVCHVCDLPLATDSDYESVREGEGAHLCWREWHGDVCQGVAVDWRARAQLAEVQRDDLLSECDDAWDLYDHRCETIRLIMAAQPAGWRTAADGIVEERCPEYARVGMAKGGGGNG